MMILSVSGIAAGLRWAIPFGLVNALSPAQAECTRGMVVAKAVAVALVDLVLDFAPDMRPL